MELKLTLRFALPKTPSLLRYRDDQIAYGLWTEVGPATVLLHIDGGALVATAIGPGADAALAAVPRTVGLGDSIEAFQPEPGLVRDLHRRHQGLRLGSTGRVFDTILPAVIGQRVTVDEAKRSYGRLVAAVGEKAPGDADLLLPPLPKAVAELSSVDLHSFGLEQARGKVVLEVARRATRLEEITEMDGTAALQRLLAITGIGPWTAAQVMGAAWGDADAIPTGDYHLPNTVAWALAGERRGTDERMLELLEPYRPQRRRALLLIKMSGIQAPRYGPRSSQSIISRSGRS
ncbi:MAG: DNA-3-methyladenine glycosylase 2 family protein [bacterium]|nr:DNA-3-methyladenine glycosylase 2 family protein [bacterium]